ncbi:DUF4391 domain-containing protein [Methylicorpusculum oleiharenae]|uniref:DUF4391 domain-containing protein n=1 Tax=Methylicorpusculum oleiharenae TaxID=1338687 RepID=UPI00135B69D1|nr:DUF4391 domain-containing protein [Methylicorpusculum oleiharenae]MCD2451085.1 DUF4391 domain-containing protein [Methylicorpusculum oleiharenae]
MNAALFAYPKQAQYGRVLSKNKIYKHAVPSAAIKTLFIEQVEQIVWQFKLAPETINLPAKPAVPEIQIFDVTLKTPALDHEVLRCIDKAIPFPIIFQLLYDQRIQPIATYKRPNEADTAKWVIDGYFSAGWLPEDTIREPLPIALDLQALYEQLLRKLLPLPQRAQEPLKEHVARINQWQGKQNEYQKYQTRLNKEKQFNRKVEINAQVRRLKTELEQLAS